MAEKEAKNPHHQGWYKYGVMVLYLEMFIAIGVSIFSIYSTLTGP